MPTALPRHSITETPEIARALDTAAALWPQDAANRAALLRRLILRGSQSAEAEKASRLEARRKVVRETSGSLTGVYPPNWRDELRAEWAE